MTTELKLCLGVDLPIHRETFKANLWPMQMEVMAANLSSCTLFSTYLLYKSIFLLSSAIIPKLLAENLTAYSLEQAEIMLILQKKFVIYMAFTETVTYNDYFKLPMMNGLMATASKMFPLHYP